MGYLYRYIDIDKEEVIYVGKVMGMKDVYNDPLTRRHEQHKRDHWYKCIGDDNILLQYIECTATDADILETWLINFYAPTGQLYNKGKANWGESKIELYNHIFGHWRNYRQNCIKNKEEIKSMVSGLAESLYKRSEGLVCGVDMELDNFNNSVKQIEKDFEKANRISRFNINDEFMRESDRKRIPHDETEIIDDRIAIISLETVAKNQRVFYEDRDWMLYFGKIISITEDHVLFMDDGFIENGEQKYIAGSHSFMKKDYNKTWRIWNAWPPRKLREVTQWEE